MQSHESRIYAIALRMMGNREDAQDCAQEAMVRIYRAMGSFKGQSALATWIYRITMNTCLDELRRRKARKVTSLDSLVDNGWRYARGTRPARRKAERAQSGDTVPARRYARRDNTARCQGLFIRRNRVDTGRKRGHNKIAHKSRTRKIAGNTVKTVGTFWTHGRQIDVNDLRARAVKSLKHKS